MNTITITTTTTTNDPNYKVSLAERLELEFTTNQQELVRYELVDQAVAFEAEHSALLVEQPDYLPKLAAIVKEQKTLLGKKYTWVGIKVGAKTLLTIGAVLGIVSLVSK